MLEGQLLYVTLSYAVTATALSGLIVHTLWSARQVRRRITQLEARLKTRPNNFS